MTFKNTHLFTFRSKFDKEPLLNSYSYEEKIKPSIFMSLQQIAYIPLLDQILYKYALQTGVLIDNKVFGMMLNSKSPKKSKISTALVIIR